jgi:hypothetical protein
VVANRHHLPDEALLPDHNAPVGGNRAVVPEYSAIPDVDSSTVLQGEAIVQNAADTKSGLSAPGHPESRTPTHITEVAEPHPKMAQPGEY